MRRESKLLLNKGVDSLVLSVEHFNRPWDQGRVNAVLILLDHAFEVLLKAAIVHRGGRIRKPRENQTIGFDECLRKALSDGNLKFLKEEQVLQLRALNDLRDAAQHYMVDLSEQHLYIHAQAGVTLFCDLVRSVFGKEFTFHLPRRVLPLSTTPPTNLAAVFERDTAEIHRLLEPGMRRRVEANAKLRGLTIVNGAMLDSQMPPTDSDIRRSSEAIRSGRQWHELFPGVATIQFTATGIGPSIDLRISKQRIPIHLVAEGTPGASVVAHRRVDSLGFYSLGRNQIADHLNLTGPKTSALIWYLKIKDDTECFQRVTIGKTSFDRYSQKAIARIRDALGNISMSEVWMAYRNRGRT